MEKLNVDCLTLIFNQMDKNPLFPCILVNREWCHLIVPILWRKYSLDDDFWYDRCELAEKLLNTIISCLSSDTKQNLSKIGIKLPSTILLIPALFDYISFCKFPEIHIISIMVGMIHKFYTKNYNESQYLEFYLERIIYKLFVSQCKNVKKLSWRTWQPLSTFPGASTCFSQLYNLYIDLYYVGTITLNEMAKICRNLSDLHIENCSKDLSGLTSLIDIQRNLKRVTISHSIIIKETCDELSKALARKCVTINHLSLHSIPVSSSFLTSLVNLKVLSISNFNRYYIAKLDIVTEKFQKYLAISKFPDLQHLYIHNLSCFKELAMLIGTTAGNIVDIEIIPSNGSVENTGMLIKAIANNCPKIIGLHVSLVSEDFIHVRLLLLNCRNLNSITFDKANKKDDDNDIEFIGDELLDILTKFSSNSLTYLKIGNWNYSVIALKRFLESCRKRTLSHFEIGGFSGIKEEYNEIIRKYINEGVIGSSSIANIISVVFE